LGAFNAHLLQVSIGPTSRLHGVELLELRLPSEAKVTLVVRDGDSFVPEMSTRLRHGDDLLVVTTEAARAQAERRLHAVSRGGRLAQWHSRSRRPNAG
jgi:cell volume regulation protein A